MTRRKGHTIKAKYYCELSTTMRRELPASLPPRCGEDARDGMEGVARSMFGELLGAIGLAVD
jgi:hypothetical protein